MSPRPPVVLTEDLDRHPAVAAWQKPGATRVVPEAVYVLRDRNRSGVYWLPGVGVDGAAIFAKRSLAARTMVERTVYEEILPRLPIACARYYGAWMDEPYGWIFVEDLGRERYAEGDRRHLRLGARWVATVHVHGQGIPAARALPDAGPTRYLEHLRQGRELIRHGLEEWVFPPSEEQVLREAVALCDRIEPRWNRVEELCDGAPPTLVHGDFQPKNVFVRSRGRDLQLCVIDWEMAGFGSPAADLTRIDLRTYWSVVRRAWPSLSWETVQRLSSGGNLLQTAAELNWASAWFRLETAEGRTVGVERLAPVARRLAALASAAGVIQEG